MVHAPQGGLTTSIGTADISEPPTLRAVTIAPVVEGHNPADMLHATIEFHWRSKEQRNMPSVLRFVVLLTAISVRTPSTSSSEEGLLQDPRPPKGHTACEVDNEDPPSKRRRYDLSEWGRRVQPPEEWRRNGPGHYRYPWLDPPGSHSEQDKGIERLDYIWCFDRAQPMTPPLSLKALQRRATRAALRSSSNS